MKRFLFVHYVSIFVLIIGGMLFVRANRHESAISIIENLKEKDIVFYSSNFKRVYINFKNGDIPDMEKLCNLGANHMKEGGLRAYSFKIEQGNFDPYTLSKLYLNKNLKNDSKYILIDVSRNMSAHGVKYKINNINYCPLTIILSKNSKSYDQSLLFAGRIKSLLNKKYSDLPVRIISTDSEDYNQSMGYIGLLLEIGDAANSYEEAKESLRIFCESMKDIININSE